MITKATATLIYKAHRAIETGLQALDEVRVAGAEEEALRSIQIRVPTGGQLYRELEISSSLAERIVSAHITEKRRELAECQERARLELCEPESPLLPIAADPA